MALTLCTHGEDQYPGAGCLKESGHAGPHMTLDNPPEPEDDATSQQFEALKAKAHEAEAVQTKRAEAAILRWAASQLRDFHTEYSAAEHLDRWAEQIHPAPADGATE